MFQPREIWCHISSHPPSLPLSGHTPEGLEFHIINCDRKAWVFEASSVEEKHLWVQAIETGIRDYFSSSTHRKEENSLCEGDKADIQGRPGNDFCADCNAPSEFGGVV